MLLSALIGLKGIITCLSGLLAVLGEHCAALEFYEDMNYLMSFGMAFTFVAVVCGLFFMVSRIQFVPPGRCDGEIVRIEHKGFKIAFT